MQADSVKMCSVPCGDSCASLSKEVFKLKCSSTNNKCQKCDESASVLLRSQDPLCKKCFLGYCKHKFRATLGKAHLVRPGDKILVAFSGGCASTALLHMIREAISEESRRKLIIKPSVIFINESNILSLDDNTTKKDDVIASMLSYGFPAYYTSLEMCYRDETEDPAVLVENSMHLPADNSSLITKLRNAIDRFSTVTMKEEFLRHLMEKLLNDIAEFLGCNMIFVADSASRLSVQLLSGIALGRGTRLGSKINLKDDHQNIPVARPLREFLARELALYNHFHGSHYVVWPTMSNQAAFGTSIFRLTESFVTGLQSEFPATVSTVFRIGSKLDSGMCSSNGRDQNVCMLCHVLLGDETNKASAARALAFSEEISSGNKEVNEEIKNLCFGCQIMAKDMEGDCASGISPLLLNK